MAWVGTAVAVVGTAVSADKQRKGANKVADEQRRQLGIDAAMTEEQLLLQAEQDNILRLMSFERDQLAEEAESLAEKQALAARGPEVRLANDPSLALEERRRRRDAFFSQSSSLTI